MTPIELIQSWNAIQELLSLNTDPEFQAEAKRLLLQLRDEVSFWNELTYEERMAIQNKELELTFQKISAAPSVYTNDQIPVLERVMADDIELPKKQTAMGKLLNK